MIVESVLVLDAALQDATIGVAVQLATVPVESGDTAPAAPTYYNEAEDGEASRDDFPEGAGPFLMTSSADAIDRNPSTRPVSDGSIDVLIRYAARNATTASGLRASSYTMRAVRRTLGLLVSTSAGEALRTRNQVQVIEVSNFRYMLLQAPVSDTLITWGLRCTVRTRDVWAAA